LPIYQPSSVVGNSHVLVALGAKGEIMSFFYPHIDFPQNLQEGMPAVYFPALDRLVWTFDPSWEASQRYVERTNIVETQLRHRETGLTLTITDFVHPTEPAFFRRFEASNAGNRPLRAKLFQYLDLQLGEVQQKNAVHYHAERSIAVAYWRHICFAIAADAFDEYGCGRAPEPNSAKRQMAAGHLNQQREEIGDIDLAVGWNVALAPGQRMVRDLIIAAEANELASVERVVNCRQLGWDALSRWTRHRWDQFLGQARSISIPSDLQEAYHRCLLATDLLVDSDTGSILAAPEFDPAFERSGGYGYCWPRDAVEVCLALDAAGYRGYMGPFLAWARKAQRPEGYWEQRYWLGGQRGPAWCTEEGSLQVDQTASVLFAMGRYARALPEHDRALYVSEVQDSAFRAASYLVRNLDSTTSLHGPAFDLWETFRGSFAYSNAAISAALMEAVYLARLADREQLVEGYERAAGSIRKAVMSRFWLGDMFARGLDMAGRLDTAADASALGLIVPFEFLNVDDPDEREIARGCVEGLVRRLAVKIGDAEVLRRFDGDGYAGGGPGALTSIWLARVFLRLSLAFRQDPETALAYRTRAIATMRAVLASGTETGLLPEMMGAQPGAHWAVPHAWTMCSFVLACLLLDELPPIPEATGNT